MSKQKYFLLIAVMVIGVFWVISNLSANSTYNDSADRVFKGPTQVVTVYFAGTLLKDDTLLQFNQPGETGLYGQSLVPELLQYLFHNQDDSDPDQHKIFVDGIGNDEMEDLLPPYDASLAARHANNCFRPPWPYTSVEDDPWDLSVTRPIFLDHDFGYPFRVHKAGYECWDFRLREAMDMGDSSVRNPEIPEDKYTLDLLDILNDHPDSKIILNILGHSRGGILAMMLAHEVSNLQRRYSSTGPLVPEHQRFEAINIITTDAVPGHPDRIGLFAHNGVFHKSHEYFKLSSKVKNYVGFYAKDERQNIFQAVVPSYENAYDEVTNPNGTRFWHLALNGGHQTMSGHPRGDGHTFENVVSGQYPWDLSRFDAFQRTGTMAVNQVTNIISQELLKSYEWGSVKFYKDWVSEPNVVDYTRADAENPDSIYHGSANCGSYEECKNHFTTQFSLQNDMDINTRIRIRSVSHPQWSPIISEGGLQGCISKGLPAPNQYDVDVYQIRTTAEYELFGNGINNPVAPDFFGNDPNIKKCTYLAESDTGDLHNMSLEDAIYIRNTDHPDNAYPFYSTKEEAWEKLVEMTDLSPPEIPGEIIGAWDNGIWYWDVAESKWIKMASSTPTGDIAAGDFTGDGKADVASCWENEGLWYQDGATLAWTKIDDLPPFSVTAGDVTGDGLDEIIGTWSSGIWYWDFALSKWTQMTTYVTDGDIAAGDFTGDGKADVASCWENEGLWYQDGATLAWTKIDDLPPFSVTAGDVTGDGLDEIIGTWSSGIWYRDFVASIWTQMTVSAPTGDIAAGDFTGDDKADVASCWSNGLWYQNGDTLDWTKVSNSAPTQLTAGDVSGN